MSTIKLVQPAPGEHVVVPSEPFAHIVLDFPVDTALMEHPEGSDSLLFRFADGSAIEMQDLYAQYGMGQMPAFEVEGEVLNGEEFFAVFGPELAPVAPPRFDASSGHGLSDLVLDAGLDAGVASLEVQTPEAVQPAPAGDAVQDTAAQGGVIQDSVIQGGAGIFGMSALSETPVLLLEQGGSEVSLGGHHDDLLLGHAPAGEHGLLHDDASADKLSLTAEAIQNGAPELSGAQEGGSAETAIEAAVEAAVAAVVQEGAVADTAGLEAVLNADLEHASLAVALTS